MSGGAEFINTADAVQYVHDGTRWQLRPFAPRPIAERNVAHTAVWSTSDDPWVAIPDATLQFRKSHADTRLIVHGHVSGWMSANDEGGWFMVHVRGRAQPTGGNPPPDHAGYFYRHGHTAIIHNMWSFHRELAGIPAGTHTVEILVGAETGSFNHNTDDRTQIICEESYPG